MPGAVSGPETLVLKDMHANAQLWKSRFSPALRCMILRWRRQATRRGGYIYEEPVSVAESGLLTGNSRVPCAGQQVEGQTADRGCMVLSRRYIAGAPQVGPGFRTGFGQQTDPVPAGSPEQQPPHLADAVSDYADLPFRLLLTAVMLSRQRPGRRPQIAWVLGVLLPGIPVHRQGATALSRWGTEGDVLPAAHTGMPAPASIRVHSLGLEMPRSRSTITVMSWVTAGAGSLSSSTAWSIQEPRQVARWMRQDTGMAQLR